MYSQTSTFRRSSRAWKDQIIKKAKDKSKIVHMSDDLGDLMYASSEEKMQALWTDYKKKYNPRETDFTSYFEKEWMGKTCMSSEPDTVIAFMELSLNLVTPLRGGPHVTDGNNVVYYDLSV